MLNSGNSPRLIDVRERAEWDLVHLEGGELLTNELMDAIVREWPQDTDIVCYCHLGVRSYHAAQALAQQGFTQVGSMRGGIDAWAREVDPSLALY